jgi:hypothetical protein|tara:strand:+ start:803 stop:1009 length:207 start_codon:yes stop_codon:yes gene_type:complete
MKEINDFYRVQIETLQRTIKSLRIELFMREVESMNIDTHYVDNFMHNKYDVDLDHEENLQNLVKSLLK